MGSGGQGHERGRFENVVLKKPINLNGNLITKAVVEIDHINHGLNKKTGKLNPKKRTNFSISDIEKFLMLLDGEYIIARNHKSRISQFEVRIDCPVKGKFFGKEFIMIFDTDYDNPDQVHTITLIQDGNMNYSNKEIIKRVEKARRHRKQLTHITNKSKLSTEDKMKLSLCKHFVQFANSKKLKLKEVAEMIDVPIQRLSEITNYKINKYTVDQLIKNLSLLGEHDAQIREYLVFLEHAAGLPTLSVMETKRLTRDIREAAIQHAVP